MIRDEINEQNFYSLYAQAHALGCDRLLEDLRELVISSMLTQHTALALYLDALEHNEVPIMQACAQVITEQFEEICQQKDGQARLNDLSIDDFVNILKADTLNVYDEQNLVRVVREYVCSREDIVATEFESAQAQTAPEVWKLLTEQERVSRQEAFEAAK